MEHRSFGQFEVRIVERTKRAFLMYQRCGLQCTFSVDTQRPEHMKNSNMGHGQELCFCIEFREQTCQLRI